VIPFVGVMVDLRVLHQAYVRVDEARIARVFGLAPLPSRWSTGAGVGAVAGVEVPLGARLLLGVEVFGLARFLAADDQPSMTPGVGGAMHVGARW
jgi:hypothetical protein